MTLSLCIAAFNEEKFIHYPLDAAYAIADEVILVDGGSTDGTVRVAKSYGKKVAVILSDNPKMFHLNKQKTIEAASSDWILQLDADETLSPELAEEIKAVVQDPTRHFAGYQIPRRNFFLTRFLRKGGQYPDYTIRLYKNGAAKFACRDIHENVELKGELGTLEFPILHYADQTFGRYLARWNRYISLEVLAMKKKNVKPCRPCYFIGKPLYTFLNMYFRHLAILDGFPGFVFSLFSAIRFWAIYIKWWQMSKIKAGLKLSR
ncbi:glycosyltransferase family 2 protein [Candidatus Roizmanbacteria bacterium]|nr:glycosyltransferase family 2 protein [Candidatus Roizmanbacteria bacterium]